MKEHFLPAAAPGAAVRPAASPQPLPVTGGIVCDSLDCGAYFEWHKLRYELAAAAQAGLELLDPAAQEEQGRYQTSAAPPPY